MLFRQSVAPRIQRFQCDVTVEVLMVKPIAESLEAVDAGTFSCRRASCYNLSGYLDNSLKIGSQLLKEARSTRHRVPEHAVDIIPVHMSDHQKLQILQVHVEHLGRRHPK